MKPLKLRLVIPDAVLKELPKPEELKLNLDGRKPRKGKNLYKRQLNRIRRLFK